MRESRLAILVTTGSQVRLEEAAGEEGGAAARWVGGGGRRGR